MTFAGSHAIETFAVIFHVKREPTAVQREVNVYLRAFRMPQNVVDALFEDQEHLPAHVSPHFHCAIRMLRIEEHLNVAGAKDIVGKPSHLLRHVADSVAIGINRPDEVAHGIDELSRGAGDGGERLSGERTSFHLAMRNFAQNGDLRQA